MDTIYEQIINYCGCSSDITLNDVKETVYVISLLTDWRASYKDCSTFLLEDRKEVIPVGETACCKFPFKPFFKPFTTSTFKFKLATVDLDIGGTYTESDELPYIYDEHTETFYIELPLDCEKDECDCEDICGSKNELIVTYEAGYSSLPECVLPVFCDIVQLVSAKRKCKCDDTCGCNDKTTEVTYATGDLVTYKIQNEVLAEILTKGYKDMLGTISLYEDIENEPWGFVV